MPSALVTGATGFIGGHLATRLIRESWAVSLLVRDTTRLASSLANSCGLVVGDLADEDALREAVSSASVIFHCAANVSTWSSWDSYYAANVLGVRNLLDAIAKWNPRLSRLVHVSTVDVYGFPREACDERCTPIAGGFGYSDSKLLGESLVRELSALSRIPYTILRPANVIGPGSAFTARIGRALESGIMLTVDGGCANAGLLYIDNLVDYMIWAAHADGAIGQCYNVRDRYDVSWREFVGTFRRALGGGRVIDLPFAVANAGAWAMERFYRTFLPAHEPLLHRLLIRMFGRTCGHSAERIRTESGLEGRIGFSEAMEKSVRWFLDGGCPR